MKIEIARLKEPAEWKVTDASAEDREALLKWADKWEAQIMLGEDDVQYVCRTKKPSAADDFDLLFQKSITRT